MRARNRGRAGLDHLRRKLTQLLDESRGAEHEHPAIPQVVTRSHIVFGRNEVGLLDKLRNPMHAVFLAARANVAVTRLRRLRNDPESHQSALACRRNGLRGRPFERRVIGNDMIGGQNHENRIFVLTSNRGCRPAGLVDRKNRGERHGRGGITPAGLEQDCLCLDPDATQLLRDEETVLLVAHDNWRSALIDSRDAQYRFLDQGALPQHWQKLLGIQFSRQRPQACARAARKYYRNDHDVFLHSSEKVSFEHIRMPERVRDRPRRRTCRPHLTLRGDPHGGQASRRSFRPGLSRNSEFRKFAGTPDRKYCGHRKSPDRTTFRECARNPDF